MGARRASAWVLSRRPGAGGAAPGSGVRRAGLSLGPAGWERDESGEAQEEALSAEQAQQYAFFCGVGLKRQLCEWVSLKIAGTELLNSQDLGHRQAQPCLGLTRHDPARSGLPL